MTGEPESLFIFIAMSGRIKLHRKVIDNPISNNIELLWLFSYLLLKANHKEKSFYLWLKKVKVEPWQFISSQVAIASHFKLSRSKVIRHLNTLVDEKIVYIKWYTKYSLFTIVNRQQYQDNEHQTIQQSIQQTDTNNNDKEWEEDKLIYNIQDFVDWRNSIKELKQNWKTVRGLPKTIKVTQKIKDARKKVTKEYTREEIKSATNKYIERIEKTIPNANRDWTHRYSLFEFITRDKWLQNYINS